MSSKSSSWSDRCFSVLFVLQPLSRRMQVERSSRSEVTRDLFERSVLPRSPSWRGRWMACFMAGVTLLPIDVLDWLPYRYLPFRCSFFAVRGREGTAWCRCPRPSSAESFTCSSPPVSPFPAQRVPRVGEAGEGRGQEGEGEAERRSSFPPSGPHTLHAATHQGIRREAHKECERGLATSCSSISPRLLAFRPPRSPFHGASLVRTGTGSDSSCYRPTTTTIIFSSERSVVDISSIEDHHRTTASKTGSVC